MAKAGVDTRIKVVGGEVRFMFKRPGQSDLVRAVEHYGQALKDFSPVFEKFWPYQLRSIRRNFELEGRPKKWRKLAPATIRERMRLGYGPGPILERSGKMKKAFKADWGPRSMRIWNTAKGRRGFKYFYAHQHGTKRVPRRIMIVLLRQDQQQFTKLAREHVQYKG